MFVPGAPLRSSAHGWAAVAIAGFLRRLHALHPPGSGPLTEVDGVLRGREPDVESGLVATFGDPFWPFRGADLASHPALAEHPDLAVRVASQASLVRELVRSGPSVVVHSDLHEENVLQDDQSLGFIDFGEAFVGAPAWEFAALAYFFSWSMAERILDAYLADPRDRDRSISAAATLALPFGLQRWAQDRRLGIDDDLHDETFLRESLDRI
jgi:hypothetical protein